MFKSILFLLMAVTSLTASAITFNDFSSSTGLVMNGVAATTTTSDGTVLRLTPASSNQAGSVFSATTVNASNFSSFFKFRITDPGGVVFDCNTTVGADGLVFVIQSVSSDLGGGGEGIGYEGIPSSVGVEFDTWCNAGNNDPNSNHLGIVTQGSVDHGGGSPDTVTIAPDFDDGNIWFAWIDYDGLTLEVRTNQTGIRPSEPTLSKEIDIPAILSSNSQTALTNAYIGFTSGTGADWGNHDIISWEYRDSFNPLPSDGADDTSCSPSTFDLNNSGILTIPTINVPILGKIIQFQGRLQWIPSDDGETTFRLLDAQAR